MKGIDAEALAKLFSQLLISFNGMKSELKEQTKILAKIHENNTRITNLKVRQLCKEGKYHGPECNLYLSETEQQTAE